MCFACVEYGVSRQDVLKEPLILLMGLNPFVFSFSLFGLIG